MSDVFDPRVMDAALQSTRADKPFPITKLPMEIRRSKPPFHVQS